MSSRQDSYRRLPERNSCRCPTIAVREAYPLGTCARRHSESEIAGFFVRYFEEGPTLGPGQFALGEFRIVLDRTCLLDGGLLRLEVIEYVAVAVGRLVD